MHNSIDKKDTVGTPIVFQLLFILRITEVCHSTRRASGKCYGSTANHIAHDGYIPAACCGLSDSLHHGTFLHLTQLTAACIIAFFSSIVSVLPVVPLSVTTWIS